MDQLSSSLGHHRASAALWNETYPKGQVVRVSDLDLYSVGSANRDLSIIVIYDIRGFNISQTRVFCDRLAAEYRARVVMPDFFRGTVAPADFSQLSSWLAGVGDWSSVSRDLRVVSDWLRTTGSSDQIGVIGFCWGGLQVVRACSNLSATFFAGVSIHGSSITPGEVRPLQRPILFIAASNDPPLQPNISSVIEQSNPNLSARFEYKTYSNMRHGFVSAGANYSDMENVQAIDDVHLTVRNFLSRQRSNVSAALTTDAGGLIDGSAGLASSFAVLVSVFILSFYSHF